MYSRCSLGRTANSIKLYVAYYLSKTFLILSKTNVMKIFWGFIFLLTVQVFLAQSKKEEIIQLTLRVDSLQTVLQKEKTLSNSKSDDINRLNIKISALDAEVISLNNKLALAETHLKNSQVKLDNSIQQISTLQAEISQKTDSMETLRKEMLALQTPPKPVVNTSTTVVSKGAFKTVTIGTQVWMTKNLDVSTFRNGDVIPQASTDEAWEAAGENEQPAWCYYEHDPANGTKYGKLYNWYAVNDPRGLAPEGYHIPTDAEWTVLTDYLGGAAFAGAKMKTTSGWVGFNTCPKCADWNEEYRRKNSCHTCKDTRIINDPGSGNGTNTSGFSGLPGGAHANFGSYFSIVGKLGHWWSATEYVTGKAWARWLNCNNDIINKISYDKGVGLSVRCVKD